MSTATAQFCHYWGKSKCRQPISEWARLCSNKTLSIKQTVGQTDPLVVICPSQLFFWWAVLGLRHCVWVFSIVASRSYSVVVVRALFIAVASCCRAQPLGAWASVVGAHGLGCPAVCEIFPDQGSNPCTLHWQVES